MKLFLLKRNGWLLLGRHETDMLLVRAPNELDAKRLAAAIMHGVKRGPWDSFDAIDAHEITAEGPAEVIMMRHAPPMPEPSETPK